MQLKNTNGENVKFSLDNTKTNSNIYLKGDHCSQKYIFSNAIVKDYLLKGYKVFAIVDNKNIGRIRYIPANASIINVTTKIDLSFNPFSKHPKNDVSTDEHELVESDHFLITLAGGKALTGFQESTLRKIYLDSKHDSKEPTTIDLIFEKCISSEKEMKEVANNLFPFTKDGDFGHLFSGENNVNLNSQYNVFNLESLKSSNALKKGIVLQILRNILDEVYWSDRNSKFLLLIDDPISMFQDAHDINMLRILFRYFRAYQCHCCLIGNSMKLKNDSSAILTTLEENSAFQFLQSDGKTLLRTPFNEHILGEII